MDNGNGLMTYGNDNSCLLVVLMAMFFGGFGGGYGRGGMDDYGRIDHQHQDTREEIRFNELTTQNQIGELSSDLYQRQIFSEICMTNRNVDAASAANLAATADAKYDNAIIAKNAEIANLKCCCETNQHISDMEAKILSRFDAMENQNLRDKISELQLGYSQVQQNQFLVSTLRPCPVPAYPSCNVWATGANGNCGSCGF